MFSYLWLYFVGFISIYKPYKIREGFVGTRRVPTIETGHNLRPVSSLREKFGQKK